MVNPSESASREQLISGLHENGWLIDDLPCGILTLLQDGVLELINNSKTTEEIRTYVNALSNEEFRQAFSKEMRFLPSRISAPVEKWTQSLLGILNACKIQISPISKNEIAKNKRLKPDSSAELHRVTPIGPGDVEARWDDFGYR